jgi:hypothetical protein
MPREWAKAIFLKNDVLWSAFAFPYIFTYPAGSVSVVVTLETDSYLGLASLNPEDPRSFA